MNVTSALRSLADMAGAGFGRMMRAMRWLDGHWIGDAIGAVCLFALLWIALVAGAVLQ